MNSVFMETLWNKTTMNNDNQQHWPCWLLRFELSAYQVVRTMAAVQRASRNVGFCYWLPRKPTFIFIAWPILLGSFLPHDLAESLRPVGSGLGSYVSLSNLVQKLFVAISTLGYLCPTVPFDKLPCGLMR